MLKNKILAISATIGIAAIVAVPAFACHPNGVITKKVQDVTTSTSLVDANTATSALTVNNGDTLKYVITISNTGAAGDLNAMINTVLKDTLPAGVQLASGGSTISENLGTIQPGKSITKEYLVKVTDSKNDDVVTNKACFTGDSTDHKLPQSGCDTAVVKIHVPETPVTPPATPAAPSTPTTPETPSTPELPATLPSTGPEALVGTTLLVGAVAYAVVYALRSKKLLTVFNK